MSRSQVEGHFTPHIDEYPLIGIRSPSVAGFDHVHVPSFFSCVDLGLSRKQPFMLLHDARGMPHVDDARQRHFMRLLDERRVSATRYILAYAAVVGSPLERGIITAFIWFVRLPFPMRIFNHEAEARAWLWTRYDARARRDQRIASAE